MCNNYQDFATLATLALSFSLWKYFNATLRPLTTRSLGTSFCISEACERRHTSETPWVWFQTAAVEPVSDERSPDAFAGGGRILPSGYK